jgi:hypothetical protein
MNAHQRRHHYPCSLLQIACSIPQFLDRRSENPSRENVYIVHLSQNRFLFQGRHDIFQLIGVHFV